MSDSLFPSQIDILFDRLQALEARIVIVENRREVRTHAKVADREDQIVETLETNPSAMTIALIASLTGFDYSAVGTSCRKLEKEGRIIRVELPGAGRHPHYTVATRRGVQ